MFSKAAPEISYHVSSEQMFKRIMSQFKGNNFRTLLKSRGGPFCLLSMRAINSCRDLLLEPGCSCGGHGRGESLQKVVAPRL